MGVDRLTEARGMAGTVTSLQHAFGPAGKTAGWDDHAWDGRPQEAPDVPEIPPPPRRVLPFLRHCWFWLVAAGQVLVVMPSMTANRTWAWATLPGYILFMAGAVLIFDRHVKWADLPAFGKVLGAGLAGGLAAFLLARPIEGGIEPRVMPFSAELWMAGPVEETSKLLVPVLLLAFGGTVFKDPRAGLLMVLSSGAFFGVAEGVFYSTNAVDYGVLSEAFTRPGLRDGAPVHDRHRGRGDLVGGLAFTEGCHEGRDSRVGRRHGPAFGPRRPGRLHIPPEEHHDVRGG